MTIHPADAEEAINREVGLDWIYTDGGKHPKLGYRSGAKINVTLVGGPVLIKKTVTVKSLRNGEVRCSVAPS